MLGCVTGRCWEICARFWPNGQNDGLGSGMSDVLAPGYGAEPLLEG